MNADSNLSSLTDPMSILAQLPEALVISNDKQSIVWCNAVFENIVGSQLDDIKQKNLDKVLQTSLSPAQESKNTYCGIVGRDKTQRWYEKKSFTLSLKNEPATIQAFLMVDISEQILTQIENKKLQDKLEQLTTIDAISGLLNKRAMLQSLEPLVSRSRRYDNPLSLVAINLLNLAALHENQGQEIADQSVLALSHLLRDQLRWADIVCRYNNDEILIILPETSHQDALNLANKILGHINELEIEDNNGTQIKLDACYGVASWQKGDDSHMLIERVKNSLVTASEQGPGSIVDVG